MATIRPAFVVRTGLLCLLLMAIQANCLYWYMEGASSKEFYVDAFQDEIVLVEYSYRTVTVTQGLNSNKVIPMTSDSHNIHIEVRDPTDAVVYRAAAKENGGHFGFTSQHDGMYRVIFTQTNAHVFARNKMRARVTMDVSVGADVGSEPEKTEETVADKAQIALLTREVSRLRDKVNIIKMEQGNSKSRDEKFSTKYAGIGSRIVFFAVFQIAFFIGVGLWQMKDLKKFLVKTKVV
ncbi:transmembrane emp24 domain-containing protein [Carpediemonas membranifera]|uniref:Transmembrane emp24 domain-containing protein n=1 Tax=Carpediemonas membranifera TaxID=201153 RepID=A0A8J6BB14_9EUKA|nr:transmembrane emp24 domain-containing protein [Carpediemonas membranifera]|eukprot:KAG9396989.1 transmembrane emp24 domain-containing protein [Carpediemonas membranifera]